MRGPLLKRKREEPRPPFGSKVIALGKWMGKGMASPFRKRAAKKERKAEYDARFPKQEPIEIPERDHTIEVEDNPLELNQEERAFTPPEEQAAPREGVTPEELREGVRQWEEEHAGAAAGGGEGSGSNIYGGGGGGVGYEGGIGVIIIVIIVFLIIAWFMGG